MATILLIDREPAAAVVLEQALRELGHDPVLMIGLGAALEALELRSYDLIVADDRLPDAAGPDLIETLRGRGLETPIVLVTSHGSVDRAVLAVRLGAADYLVRPIDADALAATISRVLDLGRMRREHESLRREVEALGGARRIVGESSALREVLTLIETVAPTRATILLEGESGTGKELFARAIHEQSPRRAGPFVTVNCAALPEGLVESTLFGHERGAFTGAASRAAGCFERADGGTLLLDEVSEMRLDLQAKLLRAIQEQEFERVGGSRPVRVDVRVIATTNRDLEAEVEAGRFRRDLFYRINVVAIRTPALRERPEDIPDLVRHFVGRSVIELGVKAPRIAPETLEVLTRRSWPGNVRELANAVERAVILCRNGSLKPEMFPDGPRGPFAASRVRPEPPPAAPRAAVVAESGGDAPFNLKVLERQAIDRALEATSGRRSRAAQLLGISERTLRNKLNGARL